MTIPPIKQSMNLEREEEADAQIQVQILIQVQRQIQVQIRRSGRAVNTKRRNAWVKGVSIDTGGEDLVDLLAEQER